MSILERFRRRGRALAAVLPLLAAFVWSSGAASGCLGMALPDGPRGQESVPAAHDESPGGLHRHAGDSQDEELHDHGACPHCPAESAPHGGDGAHVSCETAESPADAGRSTAPPGADPKDYSPPARRPDPGAVLRLAGAPGPRPAPRPLAAPAVPLTIRYCVYLL